MAFQTQKTALSALFSIAFFSSAHAGLVLDQEQGAFDAALSPLAIGGDVQQELAQTFKVGTGGPLAAIGVPVGCSSGDLIVEIRELSAGAPTGALLQQTVKAGSEFPVTPSDFVTINLDAAVAVATGQELALVLRNETGECAILRAPSGDAYADGQGWFEAGPEFGGWTTLDLKGALPDEANDLAFQTFIDVPTAPGPMAGGCFVPGFGQVPADPYSGACRCFQDADLREMRCGILHPDFFIERITPLPLKPGKLYDEVWRFTRLTNIDGPVRMSAEGLGRSKPQIHYFGVKGKQGTTETKTFTLRAPSQTISPGVTTFEYDMRNADDDSFRFFSFDTTISGDAFDAPGK